MQMKRDRTCRWTAFLLASVILAGCGGEKGDSQPSAKSNADAVERPLPTASIPGAAAPDVAGNSDVNSAVTVSDEVADELLAEITKVRTEPFPETKDLRKITAAQAERNRKIVDLARRVVAETHDDPERSAHFEQAVHYLMEARLQLALQGDRENIDALYDDAASLFERKSESAPASEAAFAVARFAHTNARRFAKKEPRWLHEFARQAKFYASNFPKNEARAAPLLFAAGRSCELNDLLEEGIACYTLLTERFPETPQGKESVAVLRRLRLPGRTLELTGPTIDGGSLNIDDYRGRPVLVVFWSSTARDFVKQLPELQATLEKYPPEQLAVVGVNLDEDESAVDAFLEQHRLAWRQIFSPQPDQQGWNNPVAQRYGVREIPLYWLIAADGRVISTTATPETLPEAIRAAVATPAPATTNEDGSPGT